MWVAKVTRRLFLRFAQVIWPQPKPIAHRLAELRHSIEAEVERRVVTDTFAAGNRAEAERARLAGERLVWHCEPGSCPQCDTYCGAIPLLTLPPLHPNCRCVVLGERS